MADNREPELLEIGTHAPDFTLPSAYGEPFTLSELRGHMNACLFFYPAHETPQNERQLSAARDDRERFVGLDVERFGVNPGSLEENQRFVERHRLDFPLLVDADLQVARRYRVAPPDEHRVSRAVYVVDKEGRIVYARRGIPKTDEILEALAR